MKNLIFIVDKEPPKACSDENEEQSAFSEGIKAALSTALPGFTSSSIIRSLGFTAFGLNPVTLILALAATSGSVAYILANAKNKELSKDELKQLEDEVNKLKVSQEQAIELGFKFPPGHPITGKLYQLHPLADRKEGNEISYIPENKFEETLIEERQSELVKLLTNLGATKIEISEVISTNNKLGSKKSLGLGSDIASISASSEQSQDNKQKTKVVRSFTLIGKPWRNGTNLDTTGLNWYEYEPQWQSIVYAREVGSCIEANIEMTEQLSLISSSDLAVNLKNSFSSQVGGELEDNCSNDNRGNKTFLINASFTVPEKA